MNVQLTPPRKVTIVDSLIQQIVGQMKDGTLKAGDRLPSERQLISMLGVSRSSVREALQALSAMDLIEIRAGDGALVKTPPPSFGLEMNIDALSGRLQSDMRHHLNQARLTLELGIVSLAAGNINEDAKVAISRAMDAYEGTAIANPPENDDWSVHDRVHLAIAEAAGNPILVVILQTLLGHVPVTLRKKQLLDLAPERRRERIEAEFYVHRQLCEAVLGGDGPAACDWMRRHADMETQIIDEYYGDADTGDS
ncbi:MAG TPA: GntR family transcriptional regulator [Anaerolineae bacterium]|nr:GntR family transcriptional regulator [Anaerolineae bacterium]